MLVVLLLISQITCEWVEISQNNYWKEPPRDGAQHIVNIDKDRKELNNVRNVSVIEKPWNKAVIDRVTNVGNIRRVQVPSVKTSSIKVGHSDRLSLHTNKPNYGMLSIKKHHEIEESVSRNGATEKSRLTPKPIVPLNKDLVENTHHHIQGSETKNEDQNNNDNKFRNENYRQININHHNKFTSINHSRNKQFIPPSRTSTPQTLDEIYNKDKPIEYQDVLKSDRDDNFKEVALHNDNFFNASLTTKPKYRITKLDNIHSDYSKEFSGEFNLPNTKTTLDSNLDTADVTSKENFIKGPVNKEGITNSTKGNTVSGMWKLMKIVTDTIYKNTHRSFKSKIQYLEDLKATIMSSIEKHIDTVWPDDAEHRNVKRSVRYAEERGHLEFPSSESTLMTISFLTFAVFLIKLVLQVIHTYKNKTMMVTPTLVAAVGRTAAAFRAKHV